MNSETILHMLSLIIDPDTTRLWEMELACFDLNIRARDWWSDAIASCF